MAKQAEQVIPAPNEGVTQEDAADNILNLLNEYDPGDGTLGTDIREDEEGDEDKGPPSGDEEDDESASDEEDEESDDVEDESVDEADEDESAEDDGTSDDLHTIVVDGEEREVTTDELRKGYQRQAAFTKKTQQLADQRRETEAFQTQLNETRTRYISELSVAEQFVLKLAGDPPSEELLDKNPNEYTRQKARHDKALRDAQTLRTKQNELLQDAFKESQARRGARQKDEIEKLLTAVPEWKDTAVANKEIPALVAFGAEQYGLTAEEISDIDDHRFYLLLRDAQKGRKAKVGAEEIRKQAKPGGKRKALRPGVRQPTQAKESVAKRKQDKALRRKLGTDGSVHDAAELFFGMDLD